MARNIYFFLALSGVLSCISVILSFLAFFKSPSVSDLSYISIIVGALALLTTVLIGWQIFVIIDLKGYDKKFNRLSQSIYSNIERIKGYSALCNAHLNIGWLTARHPQDWFITYVDSSIEAISYFSRAGEKNTCWAIIDELLKNLDGAPPEFYFPAKEHKKDWLIQLAEVEKISYYKNFGELIDYISKL